MRDRKDVPGRRPDRVGESRGVPAFGLLRLRPEIARRQFRFSNCHLGGWFDVSKNIVPAAGSTLSPLQKMVDFSYKLSSAFLKARSLPRRRPNCSRRLYPGISPGNTERVPVQATAWAAGTGLGVRLRLPGRCCAASAGLSCPEMAPQYVHACCTRFLAVKVKATWTPLPTTVSRRFPRRDCIHPIAGIRPTPPALRDGRLHSGIGCRYQSRFIKLII